MLLVAPARLEPAGYPWISSSLMQSIWVSNLIGAFVEQVCMSGGLCRGVF